MNLMSTRETIDHYLWAIGFGMLIVIFMLVYGTSLVHLAISACLITLVGIWRRVGLEKKGGRKRKK